jgi:high mobility group protein B3
MSVKVWNKASNVIEDVLKSSNKFNEQEVKTILSVFSQKRQEILNGLAGKATKKKKDPNAPKKSKTSYIFFCMENRNKLKQSNPKLSATELTSKLADMWKKISPSEKQKYEDMSHEDKSRYESEMESYSGPTEDTKKEDNGPRRPLSGYMFFCKNMRNTIKEENPELSGKDITTELGRRWKSLSDKEKQPYLDMQNEDKQRYAEEKGDAKKPEPKKPEPKKTESKKPEPKKPEPKIEVKKPESKKPSSDRAFKSFCEERREDVESDHPEWNSKKVDAELSKLWKQLSLDDKEAYEIEADLSDESDLE